MHCTVLLFAHLVDATGTDRIDVELAEDATVGDCLDEVQRLHEAVGTMRPQLAVAVNEAYARADTRLNDGDLVALIPPVSGG